MPEKDAKRTSPTTMGCAILFAVLGGLWLLGQFNRTAIDRPTLAMVSEFPAPRAAPALAGVGDEGMICGDASTSLPVAIDLRAFDELSTAPSSQLAAAMTLSGRVFPVAGGTRVAVVDRSLAREAIKITVLLGELAGRSGWIPQDAVREVPSEQDH